MTIQILQRRISSLPITRASLRLYSTQPVETDLCGIPLRPTWSVNHLLASYSSPEITPKAIHRLHELSALKSPQEGSLQYTKAKESLQDMIRLVEAVRSVDTSGVTVTGRGEREDADKQATYAKGTGKGGQDLLKNASRIDGQYYVVDSDKKI